MNEEASAAWGNNCLLSPAKSQLSCLPCEGELKLLNWKGITKTVDIQAMAAACLDRPARQDSTGGKRYWFGHNWCITLEKDSLLSKTALSPQHGMVPHLSMI